MNRKSTYELSEEVKRQLAVIDSSQCCLLIIIGSILLSYYTVSLQKQQLICRATDPALCKCLPKTFPLQATSSIMVIVALAFFYHLSAESLEEAKGSGNPCCREGLEHMVSLFVLIAAAMRFGLLFQNEK